MRAPNLRLATTLTLWFCLCTLCGQHTHSMCGAVKMDRSTTRVWFTPLPCAQKIPFLVIVGGVCVCVRAMSLSSKTSHASGNGHVIPSATVHIYHPTLFFFFFYFLTLHLHAAVSLYFGLVTKSIVNVRGNLGRSTKVGSNGLPLTKWRS